MKGEIKPAFAKHFHMRLRAWLQELNLADYRVTFDKRKAADCYACVATDLGQRCATYQIGDQFHKLETLERIDEYALHESLHILLHDLIETSKTNHSERIETVEHAVVNVLIKLLCNPSTETQ